MFLIFIEYDELPEKNVMQAIAARDNLLQIKPGMFLDQMVALEKLLIFLCSIRLSINLDDALLYKESNEICFWRTF